MSRITLDTDCDAGDICLIWNEQQTKSRLIQSDWDSPSVATAFGWSLRSVQKPGQKCDHEGTDGTVTCPSCGITSHEFVLAATNWIVDNDGAEADDPGYFHE